MNEFKRFEDRLTGLIESLSPSGRRRLSAELAKRLRQSQQRRVMAQKAPDGTPYAPRQQQSARKKTGRVKRKMFAKLITSRFLHIRASPEQASMEFYGGKSPKIASVHQFGLSEETRKDGKKIDYPARPLLGFTGEDVQMIEEIIRDAYFIHCHKGTIGAIRRVVEPLGYLINVTEWWENSDPPGTFRLDIGVLENGITEAMYQEMERLIADAKPASRHLIGLNITRDIPGYLFAGGVAYDGDVITVYPG